MQPLLMTAAFSYVFGRMGKFTTDHLPHFLFYMGGLAAWNYFSDCVNTTAYTFTKNAQVFGKVYFRDLWSRWRASSRASSALEFGWGCWSSASLSISGKEWLLIQTGGS
jgi:hypothetical protein